MNPTKRKRSDGGAAPNGPNLPDDPSRFRVVSDYGRARAVFDLLMDRFRARGYPFALYRPFNEMPLEKPLPEDPRARALFWKALCFWMRGRIESYEALWRLARVWHVDQEIFEPEFWAVSGRTLEGRRARLVDRLVASGLGVGTEKYHKYDWPANMRKLHRFWEGDPRNLIRGARTFDDLRARIQRRGKFSPDKPNGFSGFQTKMTAMLAHFFAIDGLARAEEFPFPVDIHVGRFLLYHRILEVEEKVGGRWLPAKLAWDILYERTVEPAVQLCLRYCAETGTDPVELGEAIWNFAQIMCGEAPQNVWRVAGEGSGRKVPLEPVEVLATDRFRRRFHATCGSCPVAATCRGGTIGGAPYFRWGTFSWRPSPPLAQMFPDLGLAGEARLAVGRPIRAWSRAAAGRALGPGDWLSRGSGRPNGAPAPEPSQLELGIA